MVLCGREEEIRQIAEGCAPDRLVVLVGEPGLGATALLTSGVAPALRALGYITLVYGNWQGRFFVQPFKDALCQAVREQADQHFFGEAEPLHDLLQRIVGRTGRRPALLLDQFEDYVRCHSGTELSDSFDAELAHAIASHHRAFVIAIQRHGLNAFERLAQLIPNLFGHKLTLAPLPPAAACEIVRSRAGERGLTVEPGVAEALAAAPAASSGTGVNAYLFSLGLNRLLEAEVRLNFPVVRLSVLKNHGGADRLILESLDATMFDMNSTHIGLFFRWCNLLISPAPRTRLSVTEKALLDYSGRFNRFVPTLLLQLQEKGIVRAVQMPDTIRYELARESLVPVVRDWWERREAAVSARRRALFRVRSISIAVGSVVALYAVWLLITIGK